MNDIVKVASKFVAKPQVRRAIRSVGKKIVDEVKEHGAELVENISHFFGA